MEHLSPSFPPYLLPYLCHVSSWQDLHVCFQGTHMECVLVANLVVWLSEEYVVPDSGILDPGLLGHICNLTLEGKVR